MNIFKKVAAGFAAVGLAIAAISISVPASANVVLGNDGIYYGNVCRYGEYYQFVRWAPVGNACYMPAWNLYGYISNEQNSC